jgi:cytochrome bd-type quinol oxidase subunit 2
VQPTYQPDERSGATADRVVGIIGIVLFSCCTIATGISVGAGGGMPEELPEEVKPESWQLIASLVTYVAMLLGCIGMSLSRRWGMLLAAIGGIVLLALTAYGLTKYPDQMQVMRDYLEAADLPPEEKQGMELGMRMQPFFIASAVIITLFYTIFSFLRLAGKAGPAPK